jgi:predicted nucleic acid-binding protein
VSVVIDANALVAFVTNEPTSDAIEQLLKDWAANEVSLHAPILARYEIANAFTKKLASGVLSDDALDEAWTIIDELPITYHPLQDAPAVVRIAIALERRSAYDAAYLALAQDLDAQLWTLDGPLKRNAVSHGHDVRLIESATAPEPADESDDLPTTHP